MGQREALRSGFHRRVELRDFTFTAPLGLHSGCGPQDCSTGQDGLCHELSGPASCPTGPLVGYQTYRLVIRAFHRGYRSQCCGKDEGRSMKGPRSALGGGLKPVTHGIGIKRVMQ